MSNRTFTMIKPDAVAAGNIGNILQMINNAGFRIVAMKYTKLSIEQAGQFYAVHSARPFYGELTKFMSSGNIVADDSLDNLRKGNRSLEDVFRSVAGGNTVPA